LNEETVFGMINRKNLSVSHDYPQFYTRQVVEFNFYIRVPFAVPAGKLFGLWTKNVANRYYLDKSQFIVLLLKQKKLGTTVMKHNK
jgi:hypothetical protein